MPSVLPAGRRISASRPPGDADPARRVLVVCAAGCDALSAALSNAGFEAHEARDAEGAGRAVAEFAPHVVIVAARRDTGGDEFLRFARRLRADDATRALPLVVLCRRGDEESRAAALELGADDCFPATTQPREALARIDAVLWRDEVGRGHAARRAASAAVERGAQIDDFMQLLEAARRAADAGERFSVALIAPAAGAAAGAGGRGASGDGVSAEAVKSAHEFLRLNLRRADSVAFYGPTQLVALLPRRWSRDARSDLARLLTELEDERPGARLAVGLASSPADGGDVETLIERADAELNSAIVLAGTREDSADEATAPAEFRLRFQFDGDDEVTSSPRQRERGGEFPPLPQPDAGASEGRRSRMSPGGEDATPQPNAKRALPSDFEVRRAVRESKRGDEFEAAVMPYASAGGAAGGGVLGRSAAEAAARERERRSAGEPMPRRVLLTVSDPARMAQINLLLRSAAYEVRAAFDGGQALDLLRIERADLLVLDHELKVLDGLSVLRRLHERHRGRLPMPVALLLPPGDSERLREEALRCGAAGIVQMPYDPAELLECVRTTGSKD